MKNGDIFQPILHNVMSLNRTVPYIENLLLAMIDINKQIVRYNKQMICYLEKIFN
jgi:hypothetical protein